MSIKYTIVPNPLRPGEFYPRPVQLDTRGLDVLLRDVAEKTTVSPHDAKAVVSSFIQEIINGLIDGDRVSIDGFADFRPRMSQVLDSAAADFDPATGGKLHIAATIKPAVTKLVRQSARFEKLMKEKKRPLLVSLFDDASKQAGHYTAGSIATLVGEHLKILNEAAADEGIYFISDDDGGEAKVQVLQNNGAKKLVFEVPEGLSGPQSVEVRTRYTPGGELRRNDFENIMPA